MSHIIRDPWQQLKSHTQARIALGRVGSSLPTAEVLEFGLAHALARDAVHLALDVEQLCRNIQVLTYRTIVVESRAPDRASYLLRPDWGRRLSEASIDELKKYDSSDPIDLLLVVGDGLSSLAIERHAVPLLRELQALAPMDWSMNTVVIATQARVALADEIGELMNARMVVMLIGERPGLSAPDSLGIYLTFAPKVGRNDGERNCISNVRAGGLDYAAAAKKLMWLVTVAKRIQATGVVLKDESDESLLSQSDFKSLGS